MAIVVMILAVIAWLFVQAALADAVWVWFGLVIIATFVVNKIRRDG